MAQKSHVVIVGRMNVGKSTLFNRLATQEKTITFDYEGITRDFVTDTVVWQNTSFTIVDTGGIHFKKHAQAIEDEVKKRAIACMESAAVVVFVCDAQVGLVEEDMLIAQQLRHLSVPVIVAVNKVDNVQDIADMDSFWRLGFNNVLMISAQHGKGISELLDDIVHYLPTEVSAQPKDTSKASIVLLGKPNVGKSSLMNTLLGEERMIVSPVAGTTREAVKESIRFYQETLTLIDTPGVRKKSSVDEPIEELMVKSSLRSVKKADVILLMVDGSAGELADQELKLAFYAFEQGKAVVLLINKADLVTDELRASFERQAPLYQQLLKKIPQLFISCKTQKNVGKIIPLVNTLIERAHTQFDTVKLTVQAKEWLTHTPLYISGKPLRLQRIQQINVNPITFVMYVDQPDNVQDSHKAFFDNKLRGVYDLKGVPVIWVARKSKK